ncbi:MAG: hypothetical protein GY816_10580, partial [Cytophagales bacterium]|nr:hypothetical protein [Cytophagales bacterium]
GELALDLEDQNDGGAEFEATVGLDAFEMEDESDDNLDYSQIDETIDKSYSPELEELANKEEPELEFEYEPDEPETTSLPEQQVSGEDAEAGAITENALDEDPMIADIKSKLVMQKRILLPILLLLIIIFGGFAYFFYTDQQNPFSGPDENDPGNQRVSTVEDKGYYIP